jgi:hypothetical protein
MFLLLVFAIMLLKEIKQQSLYSGSIIEKKRKLWFSSDISYIVLKRRDNTNREGNNITNIHMTRGP